MKSNTWQQCNQVRAQLMGQKFDKAEAARVQRLTQLRKHPYIAARLEVMRIIGAYGIANTSKAMLDNVEALEKVKANQNVWADFVKLGGI